MKKLVSIFLFVFISVCVKAQIEQDTLNNREDTDTSLVSSEPDAFADPDSLFNRPVIDTIWVEYNFSSVVNSNGTTGQSASISRFIIGNRPIKNNIKGRRELKKILSQYPQSVALYNQAMVLAWIKRVSGLSFLGAAVYMGVTYANDGDVETSIEIGGPTMLISGVLYIASSIIGWKDINKSIEVYNKEYKKAHHIR